MDINELNRRVKNGESFILASDGQFLGRLCLNIYDPESVSNIYGLYGNPYSSLSHFNPYTTTPPSIYLRGMKVGVLSINNFLMGSVDPRQVQEWMRFNGLF